MSHMAIKTTVSLITLNALLQIYESQAVEFFSTQMTHPKMYSLVTLPSFANIFLSLLGFQSRSLQNGFSAAVLIENLLFQLSKTLNMILIYAQMFYIGYLTLNMINHYFETYQTATPKTIENLIEPEVVKVKKVLKEKRRKAPKKVKMEVDQISQIDQVDQQSVCSIAELKKQESEFAETENAQTCDINHADLSQLSSVKIEPSNSSFDLELQFGITTTTGTTTVTTTFESFDSSFDFLNYTEEQVAEVKTHILLNLYDDNEDSCCRLWALNKLLSLQK